MIRIGAGALVVAIAACAAAPPPPAAAPATSGQRTEVVFPQMPLSTDLAAVPVGSWAEYAETFAGSTLTNRVATVAKTAEAITIESTRTGHPIGSDELTFARTLALGADEGRIIRQLLQVNAGAPKEVPVSKSPHPRLDPKTLIGTEIVAVRAGTFTTKHYRYTTPYGGDPVDAWVADNVWPIGLVRLEAKLQMRPWTPGETWPPPGRPEADVQPSPRPRVPFVYELIARGDNAEPRITRPVAGAAR